MKTFEWFLTIFTLGYMTGIVSGQLCFMRFKDQRFTLAAAVILIVLIVLFGMLVP
jgi:hypothetical protein